MYLRTLKLLATCTKVLITFIMEITAQLICAIAYLHLCLSQTHAYSKEQLDSGKCRALIQWKRKMLISLHDRTVDLHFCCLDMKKTGFLIVQLKMW